MKDTVAARTGTSISAHTPGAGGSEGDRERGRAGRYHRCKDQDLHVGAHPKGAAYRDQTDVDVGHVGGTTMARYALESGKIIDTSTAIKRS
jgi:hypothetical protein